MAVADLSLARQFRNAVLNISAKEGQPGALGTAGGTVFYNDGTNDHLNRVWVRMGADQQVLVVANVGKHGLPSTPGLEVNVAMRHGSLYVDDWVAPTGIGGTTAGGGLGGHTHDYETRNVKVSEHAGTPAGSDNVVVGNAAGDALGASSAENVIVGSSAGASAANDAESVVIGYNAGNYAAVAPLINSWDSGTDISDTPPTDKIFMHRDGTRSTYEHSAKVGSDTYVYQWSDKNNAVRYIRAFNTDGTYGDRVGYVAPSSTAEFTICSLNSTSQTFLIGYMKNTGTFLDYYLRVCSVSGVTITLGAEFHLTGHQGNPSVLRWSFHVERLSNTTSLVTLAKNIGVGVKTLAMVATTSAMTVSVGSTVDYTSGADVPVWQCFSMALSSSRAIIVWVYSYFDAQLRYEIRAVEASISGSTITLGASDYQLAADSGEEPSYAYGQALSSTKFIITFIRATTAVAKTLVGEVDVSDVITKGSEVTIHSDVSADNYPPTISVVSSSMAVIAYEVAAVWGWYARFVTISGLVPTLDTADYFHEDDDRVPHVYYDDASLVVIYESDDTVGGSWDYARFTIGNLITNTRTANTFVGAGAGGGDDTSYGVAIGHDAGANEAASYRLYIDISNTAAPLIYGEFDDDNLGINTVDMAGGEGVIAIANASVVPSGTPTGGGVLYVESGALKYKGSSGTITVLGVA